MLKHLTLLLVLLIVIAEVSATWRLKPVRNPRAISVFEPTSNLKHKRGASFQFNYDSSNPAPSDVKDCFQRAGDILSSSLNLNVPVKVLVSWEVLTDDSTEGTILGAAAPGRWCDGGDFWYAPALLDQIQNRDTLCQSRGSGGTTYDIIASFNSDLSPNTWNTNPDNLSPASGEVDLTSVILHELIHGLGFQGLISQSNSGTIDLRPDERGSVFDAHLYTGANHAVKVTSLSQNGIATAATSDMWFQMSAGVSTGAPTFVQLYTPAVWEQGSSVYHVSEEAVTNPADQLMLPTFQGSQVLRSPGPIALGVLQSLGYAIGGSNTTVAPVTNPSEPTVPQDTSISSASAMTMAVFALITLITLPLFA